MASYAEAIKEIQSITTSADSGDITGTFAVDFDMRPTGGSLQVSGEIPHGASTSTMKEVFHFTLFLLYSNHTQVFKTSSPRDMESIACCRHAVNNFTLEALGAGTENAGGARARNNRFEVLDRLARLGAGLSAGQKNDWTWFKAAWDKEMVNEHEDRWAKRFSERMQSVLEDECSNAFSTFVYKETCRVFHDTAALHVPGS